MSLADKFNIPKTLHDYIVGVMKEQTEYQAKVKALMAKKGIKSLADLSPDEKKAFFSQLDSMHQAKNEQKHPEDTKDDANKLQKSGTKKWLTVDYKDGKPVNESDGPVVWEKDEYAIEKKDEDTFCLYVKGKKVGEYPTLKDAKDAIENEDDEDEDEDEKEDDSDEMDEASSPAQQAAIAIAMKKDGKKPKDMQEAPVGGGTSIKSSESDRAKATADRAKITMQAAQLRIKQAKEREALSKKKQAIKSEFDPLAESFSDAQIAKLKAEYSKINTIDPSGDGYKKLTAMLDKLDKPTLEKLAGAGIKFVSGLAKNRVNRMKNEELSPKQKALDKNKNGKIDGSDLAKLRNEEEKPEEFKQGGAPLAKKFEKAFAKLGIKTKIKMKTFGNVSVNEAKSDYDIYHKDFSTAVQHAIKTAEKRGYKVDNDDWDRKVAMGPRKPGEGKTNSYSITLMDKNGKPVKKALQMQVYNKGGQNPYELNMYIEDVDMNAIFSEAMKKEKEASAKDKNKTVKSGDKLSGKQEPIEIQPELKEEK